MLLGGIAAAAITGFSNPEAWWARFSPQLWLIAPLALAAVLAGNPTWWQKVSVWGLTTLLAINLAMTVWSVTNSNVPANLLLRQQLRDLANYSREYGESVVVVFNYFPSNRVRLTEAGVKWRAPSGWAPGMGMQLVRSDTSIILDF